MSEAVLDINGIPIQITSGFREADGRKSARRQQTR